MKTILLVISSLFLSFSSYAQENTPVSYVDLDQYLGRWYEVASIPQGFQQQCTGGTTAEYSRDADLVKVINSCDTKSGDRSVSEGRARIEDTETNAKLKVTFVKMLGKWVFSFAGDYWIIDLAPDYRYAVVGHPTREYAWILSRQGHLSTGDWIRVEKSLRDDGYDSCRLLTTPQQGGLPTKRAVCEYVDRIQN